MTTAAQSEPGTRTTAARRDPGSESPWRHLRPRAPYVLSEDQTLVADYNAKARPAGRIHLEIPPAPFIGSYQSARVVILTKCPAWGEETGAEYDADPAFAEAMWQNLTFGNADFPFYAINPAFSETGCYKWWQPYLKELVAACDAKTEGRGLERVAHGLFSVAFFPYHVNDYTGKAGNLPRQRFAQTLVSDLRREDVPIVITGRAMDWTEALPRLKDHAHKTRNSQNAAITPGNLPPGVFDNLVERLTAG